MWRIIVPVSSRQSPHSSGGHDDHVERGARRWGPWGVDRPPCFPEHNATVRPAGSVKVPPSVCAAGRACCGADLVTSAPCHELSRQLLRASLVYHL